MATRKKRSRNRSTAALAIHAAARELLYRTHEITQDIAYDLDHGRDRLDLFRARVRALIADATVALAGLEHDSPDALTRWQDLQAGLARLTR